jgi:pimeloyl-ACP methyl ester carboxylesterase
MGESHIGWRPVIDALAAQYDVIAVDLPGFGRSPALPIHKPPTAANLAAAVESALDGIGVDRFHVAGYSLGARIAIHLAGSDRVKSAIAIGPDGLGTPIERIGGYFGLLAGRGVAIALAPVAAQLSQTGVGRTIFFAGNRSRPWQLAPVDARQLLTDFADAPAYDAANWAGLFDVPMQLFSVSRPILFLQGTADPISGQAMRYLPFIPQARFKWLPGSNHVPISDDPETVVSHMLEFLEEQ